jgi:hypothetical protein
LKANYFLPSFLSLKLSSPLGLVEKSQTKGERKLLTSDTNCLDLVLFVEADEGKDLFGKIFYFRRFSTILALIMLHTASI